MLQWTNAHNSLLLAIVEALFQINLDFNCTDVHLYLLGNKELIQKS
jgi:hypothetical protein